MKKTWTEVLGKYRYSVRVWGCNIVEWKLGGRERKILATFPTESESVAAYVAWKKEYGIS